MKNHASSLTAVIGAGALIIAAIILGFTGGNESIITTFLLNAGLFLGIQKAGNVATKRIDTKYGQVEYTEGTVITPDGAATTSTTTMPVPNPEELGPIGSNLNDKVYPAYSSNRPQSRRL